MCKEDALRVEKCLHYVVLIYSSLMLIDVTPHELSLAV